MPLTADEERELFRRMSNGDATARETLIVRNLPLVTSIARRYPRHRLPLDDLVAVGNIGLVRAVDRFDVERGSKLSTFATPCIHREIQKAIGDATLVRVPGSRQSAVREATRKLTERLGREPTADELRDAVGPWGVDATFVSLDSLDRDAPSVPPLTDRAESADDIAERKDAVLAALAGMKPRQREVVMRRFGIGRPPELLGDIGRAFGLSRERVRQIEQAGLKRAADHLG